MMNKKEIFRKIGVIISELNEQYEYLNQTPENLNELELELFMANSRFLSDHIAILNKLNLPSARPPAGRDEDKRETVKDEDKPASKEISQSEPEPQKPAERSFEPEVKPADEAAKEEHTIDYKEELIRFDWPTDTFAEEEETPEPEIKDEEEAKAVQQPSDEKNKPEEKEKPNAAQEEKKPEPTPPGTTENPVVNEVKIAERTITVPIESVPEPTPVKPAPTINDLLFAKSSQSNMASQLNQQPVKDLKSIISLNDKLLFIKDLFNGYSLAYSEAIEILNRFDNFQAADNFLKTNYATKNGWASKQSTVDKLYGIMNRRFA